MKKLNLLLGFLILALPCAYGQSYSSLALQNSPGSYARAIPYAQLTLCLSTDTAVPCTQKAAIFTDDSLTTRCTATNSSGTLTNAPISGANCNNPGISDGNGNFTIYALAGNYRLCTFGQTTLCQEITVGGGGTGNITCPGANNGALAAWLNSTTVGCTNLAYTDFAGGLFSQFYQAVGPVNGEVKLTTVGVVPTLALPAHTLSWVAPNVVPTSLRMNAPGIECTDGQVWQQLSHGPDPTGTENIYFTCLTAGFGSGTVTSVAQVSPTGVLSQSGGPVTTAGTFTWVWSATSGGLLCFTGASTAASSGLLAANAPLIGGGAGVCPTTGTRSGNTTVFGTTSGGLVSGDCAKFDASGNIVDAGAACGTGSGGGANKIPFDSMSPAQSYNQGNSYWVIGNLATATNISNSQALIDIGHWEFKSNSNADVLGKLEIPSNASGTMQVILDLASSDTTAGHTAAFTICYAKSSSQNLNNLTYTCTASQNYVSTATAFANTRLTYNIASATVGEYLLVDIFQATGGTNVALSPIWMTAKVKVF